MILWHTTVSLICFALITCSVCGFQAMDQSADSPVNSDSVMVVEAQEIRLIEALTAVQHSNDTGSSPSSKREHPDTLISKPAGSRSHPLQQGQEQLRSFQALLEMDAKRRMIDGNNYHQPGRKAILSTVHFDKEAIEERSSMPHLFRQDAAIEQRSTGKSEAFDNIYDKLVESRLSRNGEIVYLKLTGVDDPELSDGSNEDHFRQGFAQEHVLSELGSSADTSAGESDEMPSSELNMQLGNQQTDIDLLTAKCRRWSTAGQCKCPRGICSLWNLFVQKSCRHECSAAGTAESDRTRVAAICGQPSSGNVCNANAIASSVFVAFAAHPQNCRCYFVCGGRGSGSAELRVCPEGYHFNRRAVGTQVCAPRTSAGCVL